MSHSAETRTSIGHTIGLGCLCFVIVLLLIGLSLAALEGGESRVIAIVTFSLLLPTFASSGLALIRWSTSRKPLAILKWILLAALPFVPIVAAWHFSRSLGQSLLIGFCALVLVALAWFPQVALAMGYFHLRTRGGISIARRFSLRAFLVAVTFGTVVLGMATFYVRSNQTWQRIGVTGCSFDSDQWQHWTSNYWIPATAKGDPSIEVSELIHAHVIDFLERQGYREEPLPDDLRAKILRRLALVDAEQEDETTVVSSYYVKRESLTRCIDVMIVRHNGLLVRFEMGILAFRWNGPLILSSVDPTLAKERDHVVDYYFQSIRTISGGKSLNDLEQRLEQLRNQQQLPTEATGGTTP